MCLLKSNKVTNIISNEFKKGLIIVLHIGKKWHYVSSDDKSQWFNVTCQLWFYGEQPPWWLSQAEVRWWLSSSRRKHHLAAAWASESPWWSYQAAMRWYLHRQVGITSPPQLEQASLLVGPGPDSGPAWLRGWCVVQLRLACYFWWWASLDTHSRQPGLAHAQIQLRPDVAATSQTLLPHPAAVRSRWTIAVIRPVAVSVLSLLCPPPPAHLAWSALIPVCTGGCRGYGGMRPQRRPACHGHATGRTLSTRPLPCDRGLAEEYQRPLSCKFRVLVQRWRKVGQTP